MSQTEQMETDSDTWDELLNAKDLVKTICYTIIAGFLIVIAILAGILILRKNVFNCTFENDALTSHRRNSESFITMELLYVAADDYDQYRKGLKGTSFGKCQDECAQKTCFVPILGDSSICDVDCMAFASCLKECDQCGTVTQNTKDFTCISPDKCIQLGF